MAVPQSMARYVRISSHIVATTTASLCLAIVDMSGFVASTASESSSASKWQGSMHAASVDVSVKRPASVTNGGTASTCAKYPVLSPNRSYGARRAASRPTIDSAVVSPTALGKSEDGASCADRPAMDAM